MGGDVLPGLDDVLLDLVHLNCRRLVVRVQYVDEVGDS